MTEQIKKIFVNICNTDTDNEEGMEKVSKNIYKILALQSKKNPNILYNNTIVTKYPYMEKEKCSK